METTRPPLVFGCDEPDTQRWQPSLATDGYSFIVQQIRLPASSTRAEKAKFSILEPASRIIAQCTTNLTRAVQQTFESVQRELDESVAYATFSGVNTVILPHLNTTNNSETIAQMANLFAQLLVRYPQVKMILPVYSEDSAGVRSTDAHTWTLWHQIRSICDFNENLLLAFFVGSQLPSQTSLTRWMSEPIGAIMIPADIFIPNAKQYPVLPKSYQSFLLTLLTADARVILFHTKQFFFQGGHLAYLQYLRYLEKQLAPPSSIDKFAAPFYGAIQLPLQPLSSDLSSSIYATFELDKAKYDLYESAIERAIQKFGKHEMNIAILGAGGGPLVTKTMDALARLERSACVWAVEKNPSAFQYLQHKNQSEWNSKVKLAECDMREWMPPSKMDIVISELLGSFGDNELSPECLEKVPKILSRNGVCIPSSYRNFVTPMMNPKFTSKMRKLKEDNKDWNESLVLSISKSEFNLAREEDRFQEMWEFSHAPLQGKETLHLGKSLNRRATRRFSCQKTGVLNVINGYFEAVLYENICISTVPPKGDQNASQQLLGWFPACFPLSEPILVFNDETIEVSIWRQSDGDRCWYEWSVTVYDAKSCHRVSTKLHNVGGRSSSMPLRGISRSFNSEL